jgi:hypothetical protein
LSVTPFDGSRSNLAPQSVGSGGSVSTTPYGTHCYDFSTASDAAANILAYTRYVDWMIDEFHPTWLNVAIEINLYFEDCGASATSGAIQVSNAAYQAAHAHAPGIVTFPSIQIDHLYGYAGCGSGVTQAECASANYANLTGLMRDRFAMSSYPIPLVAASAAALPSDYFTRGAAMGHERPLVAETGADSTAVVIAAGGTGNNCTTVFTEAETDEASYLTRLLADATANHFDLINWWSDRDLVVSQLMTACPCTFDSTWCAVNQAFRGSGTDQEQAAGELALKAFGTMGLRDYAGSAKALYSTWQAARATHQ